MERTSTSPARGFTFIELMVSLALGMLVVGAAVKLFSQGVDATWVVSQRAEMQQDLRASQGLLFKDISLAGAGLPAGQGIALPNGGGVSPIYGCDQSGTAAGCPPNGGVNYPTSGGIPTLYGIMPGFAIGVTPPGSTTKTDLITTTYSDTTFAINCYSIAFNATGNVLTFTAPATPLPAACVLPPGIVYPQAVNDPVVGLLAGDLVLFQNSSGYAVGEVSTVVGPSGAAAPGNVYTVSFNNNDPLKINQSGVANDLTQIKGGGVTVANRIFVITYYLRVNPDPAGITTGIPVLYRQVNGQTAVPVAENVVNLQFTYDTYDSTGALLNQTGDGGESLGVSLNLIRKVNIAHLSIRSQMDGTRSALFATYGFQGYDVQTSISARNLSYQNRYSF